MCDDIGIEFKGNIIIAISTSVLVVDGCNQMCYRLPVLMPFVNDDMVLKYKNITYRSKLTFHKDLCTKNYC